MYFHTIKSEKFNKVRSKLTYGIEIEIAYERAANYVNNNIYFIENQLGNKWYIKVEHCGWELVSPILQGDAGLDELERACNIIKNCEVNKDCGLHLHINLECYSNEQLRKIATAYASSYNAWKLLVAPSRINNCFCRENPDERTNPLWIFNKNIDLKYIYDSYEEDGLQTHLGIYDRYWCNWLSMEKHGTLEIRLHHGTVNYQKIKNWILAHLKFIEWAAKPKVKVERILNIFGEFQHVQQLTNKVKKLVKTLNVNDKEEIKLDGLMKVLGGKRLQQFYLDKVKQYSGIEAPIQKARTKLIQKLKLKI